MGKCPTHQTSLPPPYCAQGAIIQNDFSAIFEIETSGKYSWRMRMRSIYVMALVLFLSAPGLPDTLVVPSAYPTIQSAIEDAENGDLILVAPGTYIENVHFKGKFIELRSDQDLDPETHDIAPEATVIDGNQNGSVVVFEQEENEASRLEGFTITNGTGTGTGAVRYGGGILCRIDPYPTKARDGGLPHAGSSPTIINNIIIGNSAFRGAGIYCIDQSAPRIERNTIRDNEAIGFFSNGGGICCSEAHPLIVGNIITRNKSYLGGGIGLADCHALLQNNIVAHNEAHAGGGISINRTDADLQIVNCTIVENTAANWGGGIYCMDDFSCVLKNSIVRDNITYGLEIEITLSDYFPPSSELSTMFSNVKGGADLVETSTHGLLEWDEGSMIDEDPLFANPANEDFHITRHSPCINRGTNDGAPVVDIDGHTTPFMGTADMGADEFVDTHVLASDMFQVSAAVGGTASLFLNAGSGYGGRQYFLLGSAGGTAPGILIGPGATRLPLNWDSFTEFVIAFANTTLFSDFTGALDAEGYGTAKIETDPLPPDTVGLTLHFAYLLLNPCNPASNPIALEIVP